MSAIGPATAPPSRRNTQINETQLAASVVLAIHRLVKQSTLYTSDNEAQTRQLDQTQQAVLGYGRRTGKNPKIYFTERSVFVNGRLLRAGRGTYDAALEIGRLLSRFGVDEVTIGHDVTVEELKLFQKHVADGIRRVGESPAKQHYERIRLRRGRPPLRGRGAGAEQLKPEEQVIRGYATSIVVMRRFLEALQAGKHTLPNRVRRLAEQLADLGAVESPVFLASIALYNSRHEHAGRAINSALVALGMARQLTDHKPLLSRIALAALLFDVGVPRVAGTGPLGDERIGLALPRIGEEQYAELPAATASVVTALGGLSKASKAIAVLVYEAMSVIHHEYVSPLYDATRAPTLEARILATARRFTALVADPDDELTADQAIGRVIRSAGDPAQKSVARLLMSALGIFPSGALVELDDGALGEVAQVATDAKRFAFPVVRVVGGGTRGESIDLAQRTDRRIVRVVGMSDEPPARSEAFDEPRADEMRFEELHGDDEEVDERFDHEGDRRSGEVAEDEDYFAGARVSAAATADPEVEQAFAGLGWTGPADEDDEDDVPSMVLQAIVDGRRPEEEEATTAIFRAGAKPGLGALFFGEGEPRDDGAEEEGAAAPRRPPVTDAAVPARSSEAGRSAAVEPARTSTAAREPISVPFGEGAAARTPAGGVPAASVPRGTPRGMAPPPLAPTASGTPTPTALGAAALTSASRGKKSLFSGGPGDEPGPASAPQSRPSPNDWLRDKLADVAPTAHGSLAKTPLVHLLVYTLDRSLSGTLMLAEGASAHCLYFDRGVPSKVRTTGSVAPLDQVLLEMGLLDEATLAASLAAISKTGELHGRHLVKSGRLEVASVKAALAWQLVRKVGFMLKLPPTTRYAFYADHDLLSDYGGPELVPVEPLALIMTGARILGGSEMVEQTLGRLGPTPLRLRREAMIEKLALKDSERRIVELLRVRALTLRELLAREMAHPRVVQLTIYALLVTRYLKVGDQQRPPLGADRPAIPLVWPGRAARAPEPSRPEISPSADPPTGLDRAPPRPISAGEPPPQPVVAHAPLPRRGTSSARGGPLPRRGTSSASPLPRRGTSSAREDPMSQGAVAPLPRRGTKSQNVPPPPRSSSPSAAGTTGPPGLSRLSIASWFAQIEGKNHFEILEVPIDAPMTQVQSSYFQLAKIWHPDRLPADMNDVRPQVSRIFARINEAFQTLSSVEKRRHYTHLVQSGGGTAKDREILERAVDSAMLFQKGEVFFKKGDYGQAEFHVRQAVDADPDQPEYRALLAWIQAHRLGPPPEGAQGHYERQIRVLDEVIASDPDFERARFYRGTLLKRSGKLEGAIADFKVVVELNPRNIDAAREVRLFQKRLRDDNKPGDGLLGRFFKKK